MSPWNSGSYPAAGCMPGDGARAPMTDSPWSRELRHWRAAIHQQCQVPREPQSPPPERTLPVARVLASSNALSRVSFRLPRPGIRSAAFQGRQVLIGGKRTD